jgi:MOSC domain-containing protein YiiM
MAEAERQYAAQGLLGDARRHLEREALEKGLAALPEPPRDRGTLGLIVARREDHRRETPERVRLTPGQGVPGDRWSEHDGRPESQLAVMRVDVARLLANGQELSLFGDNLLVDLDLSAANLPPGSRLRLGHALLEVTPEPHNGCRLFRQRFGADALRLTAAEGLRDQHLRGIYLRVVEAGDVAVGDPIEVISRTGSAQLA